MTRKTARKVPGNPSPPRRSSSRRPLVRSYFISFHFSPPFFSLSFAIFSLFFSFSFSTLAPLFFRRLFSEHLISLCSRTSHTTTTGIDLPRMVSSRSLPSTCSYRRSISKTLREAFQWWLHVAETRNFLRREGALWFRLFRFQRVRREVSEDCLFVWKTLGRNFR